VHKCNGPAGGRQRARRRRQSERGPRADRRSEQVIEDPLVRGSVCRGQSRCCCLSCYWIARTYRALTYQRAEAEPGDADGSSGSADHTNFPLIGTNGARSGLDVIRFLLAGASAVEMASLVLTGGYEALAEAREEIDAYLDENSTSATELIGRAAMVNTFESFPDRSRPWATLPIE
jgi:hypothetical protein